MTYHQITAEERIAISTLRKEGLNSSEIARRLGRHRSTISREVRRNRKPGDHGYRPVKAHGRACYRRRMAHSQSAFHEGHWRRVRELLGKQWSPEQISGHLAREGEFQISHETIYRYIWRDMSCGGTLYQNLRQSPKQRRKRYRSYDSRGKLAGKRMIGERPGEVEARQRLGHWEIDTVMGTGEKDCIVTVVERKSGYLLIGKLPNRTKDELNKRVVQLIGQYAHAFKTITADNGTEFHGYKDIEDVTGVPFYFATPHHSWERGSNENTNGLIRQYLPKGSSMAGLTQQQCSIIAKKLNTRPRKRHDYKTPEACFYGL